MGTVRETMEREAAIGAYGRAATAICQVLNGHWNCAGGMDKTFARAILAAMGLSPAQIAASEKYFNYYGGHCDCEILLNCDR